MFHTPISPRILLPKLLQIKRFDDFKEISEDVDRSEPFPLNQLRKPRGKSRGRQKVALPAGYLDDLDDDSAPCMAAEVAVSGG